MVSPHPFVSSLSSLSLDLLDAAPATAVAEPVVVVFAGEHFEIREAGKAGQSAGEGARLWRGFGCRWRVAWGIIGRGFRSRRGGATRLQRCTTPSKAARGAWRSRQHDRRLRRMAGEATRRQREATMTVGRSSSWHEGERVTAVPHRGSVSSVILAVSM
jgi:hypothetical protein